VIDSRDAVDANAIRRRRECQECQKRFTTFETIEPTTMQVQKRDGSYEDYQQQKLVAGLESACRHTKVSRDQITLLAAKVTADVMQKQERVITTQELGTVVMGHLQALDPVAYVRFACVYKRLKNIGDVIKAIQSIQMNTDLDEENIHAAEKK